MALSVVRSSFESSQTSSRPSAGSEPALSCSAISDAISRIMLRSADLGNVQSISPQLANSAGTTNLLPLSLSIGKGFYRIRAFAMRIQILLAMMFLTSPLLADMIHLNDGSTINGDIKKAADGWYVTTNGKT